MASLPRSPVLWGILAATGLASVTWMLAMAQGFPPWHRSFVTHLALPLLVLLGCLRGPRATAGVPSAVVGVGVGILVAWGNPLLGLLLVVLGVVVGTEVRRLGAPLSWLAIAAGLSCGVAFPVLESAEAPTTQPVASASQVPPAKGDEILWLESGEHRLRLEPLLRFQDSAPRGGWALSAPPAPPPGKILSVRHGPLTEVESWTLLSQPVYSHLNTYTDLLVTGVQRPRVRVARLPAEDVPLREEPALFASWDGDLTLRRAQREEKGPFRTLGRASMGRGDPLEVAILDGDRPILRVRWLDWSRQAGSGLSPTAGWGVPVNSLEFVRAQSGAVHVFLTLAATSVGRGLETVGHSPGLYRNRVQCEWLSAGRE